MPNMTDADIKKHIAEAVQSSEHDDDTILIVRADRHNRQSTIQAIEFTCDELSFEDVSRLAGAFMTPNIKIEPLLMNGIDGPPACNHKQCHECSASLLKVTLRAPGDESQLVVEGDVQTIQLATPQAGDTLAFNGKGVVKFVEPQTSEDKP